MSPSPAASAAATASAPPVPDSMPAAGSMTPMSGQPVHLQLNGQPLALTLEPWTTLLDLLRERLDLTGTKKGCDHGQCGACTVLVDGKRMNSCLLLAVSLDGRSITTVEGLPALVASPDAAPVPAAGALPDRETLHPLQQSFIDCDALQCGYCTPGQLCSAAGLLNEPRPVNRHELRERLSGNLCRCGAYPQIVDAVSRIVLRPDSAVPAVCAATAAMVASAAETGEVRE